MLPYLSMFGTFDEFVACFCDFAGSSESARAARGGGIACAGQPRLPMLPVSSAVVRRSVSVRRPTSRVRKFVSSTESVASNTSSFRHINTFQNDHGQRATPSSGKHTPPSSPLEHWSQVGTL
jgi:hypothetical protein